MMDFKSLKVAELKEELKKRGLAVSGKKAELVSRLEEYETNEGAATGDREVEKQESPAEAKQQQQEEEEKQVEEEEEKQQQQEEEEEEKQEEEEEEKQQQQQQQEEKQQQQANKETKKDATPPPKGSSRALMVSGFQRPFTLSAARAFMEQHGTVVDMWMPVIKDKAYVVYATVSQAEAAFKGVVGKTWPSNSTKTLEPVYISVYEAESVLRKGKGEEMYVIERTNEDPEDPPAAPQVEEPEEVSGSVDEEDEPPQKKMKKIHDEDEEHEAPKDLSHLFRSTQATPMLYWQTAKPYHEEQQGIQTT